MDIKTIIMEGTAAVIGAAVAWFPGRRKNKADSKKLEYENLQTMLSTYRTELESMEKRITDYVAKINELEQRVDMLSHENSNLKDKLAAFEKKYGKQTKTTKLNRDGNT